MIAKTSSTHGRTSKAEPSIYCFAKIKVRAFHAYTTEFRSQHTYLIRIRYRRFSGHVTAFAIPVCRRRSIAAGVETRQTSRALAACKRRTIHANEYRVLIQPSKMRHTYTDASLRAFEEQRVPVRQQRVSLLNCVSHRCEKSIMFFS
jgi:hypothetical protein